MVAVDSKQDTRLMAHLLRRAGFGATPDELDRAMAEGYEATVDELLSPDHPDVMPDDLMRRYHVGVSDMRAASDAVARWMYRMVMTDTPLREKMCLFWHRIFATGSTKTIQTRVIDSQIDMFRRYGMGSFRELLVQISKDPAMIMWLDNQDNHAANINENYGREILELFSMGVGNYTEDDIKECARAFTGWRIVNPEYMSIKMRNNTARPYAYMAWQFEYDDDDHDHEEKTLLGETGNLNGEDAVNIICRQEATARFISRQLCHFFLGDELPVPQWPHEPPRNPEAVELMSKAYFDSDYSIGAMLEALFKSDLFKAEAARYARIKSPAEMVVGTMRLAGPIELPSDEIFDAQGVCANMGQSLMRPPSVEGWQGGDEWINTGAYVQRVNFASRILNDPNKIGVRDIIERVKKRCGGESMSSEDMVDLCLDVLGPVDVIDSTRQGLKEYASKYGTLSWENEESSDRTDKAVVSVIQLIVSTQEYQTA